MRSVDDLDNPQLVLQTLLREDFSAFLRQAFSWIRGGERLTWNWHLDAIDLQLERVRRGECQRLIVTMPPRNLKSITISVAWVAWMLGRDPRLNFVCVSYAAELSGKLARDCLAIMQSPWYRELFPGTIISSKRSANYDFETTKGGGRLATSISGTLTGRGGDIVLIDDALKPADAMSETIRESVNLWFFSTLASRLDDKQKGAIVVIMQRLHQYDLAGMLLEKGGWDELRLPAVASEDAVIPLARGRIYHRKAGEALHADREPCSVLDEIKRTMGSMLYTAQYLQEPVPAQGNFVQPGWFGYYDNAPERGEMIQSWDTASKEGVSSDFSVGITARYWQKRFYIIDVVRERMEFGKLRKKVAASCRRHRVERLLIEDAASGQQLLQIFRRDPPPDVPRPIPCRPENDKITRFCAQASKIEAGDVVLPKSAPWLADFIAEICGFPNAKHDDQADALAQLLAHPPVDHESCFVAPMFFPLGDV